MMTLVRKQLLSRFIYQIVPRDADKGALARNLPFVLATTVWPDSHSQALAYTFTHNQIAVAPHYDCS
jgi:hypothetical protein